MKRKAKTVIHPNGSKVKKQKFCYVYVLFNNGSAIYVGITNRVAKRMYDHRRDGKTFDKHLIVAQTTDRSLAVEIEHACIIMLQAISPEQCINKYVAIKCVYSNGNHSNRKINTV